MASEAAEFWARRRELDPSPDDNDSEDDGGDTNRQLVLLADVADDPLRPTHTRVAERLDEFECLAPSPFETLHLTIKVFDVAVDGTGVVDPAVDRIDDVVSRVVENVEPFDVEFTRMNLFPDVVYAEVDEDDRLTELNRRLCADPAVATLARDTEGFIPHLTLGYFTGDTDYDALVTFLETNREVTLPALTVDELALVAYDLGEHWPPTYDPIETYEL